LRARTASPGPASATTAEAALARVRAICLGYPGTTETSAWGHPNFRAGKKTFVTFESFGGRPSIAFRLEPDQVRDLCAMRGFFPTPYGRGLWVSLRADGRLSWRLVQRLIDDSYRQVATPRMRAALDQTA
jgi:predicted DNA-binding protein (MmcQ/YjbR family)